MKIWTHWINICVCNSKIDFHVMTIEILQWQFSVTLITMPSRWAIVNTRSIICLALTTISLLALILLIPFHRYTFWQLFCSWLLKTLWQNEKLPIVSSFSFCHNVFHSYSTSIILSFKEKYHMCAQMFLKSSAAYLFHVGKD